jgi:hypothetical protein
LQSKAGFEVVAAMDASVVQDVLATADVLLCTDCHGRVVRVHGGVGIDEAQEMAPALDLAIAALRQLGQRHETGELEATLFMFRGRLVAVAETPDSGRVTVLADASVQPGLLLSQVRRLISGSRGAKDQTAGGRA